MPIEHVALVGHCGFDSGSLTRFAKQVAPLANVSRINDQAALDKAIKPGTLLLVNRVLDGSFKAGGSGIDMIRELTEQEGSPPVMLISNYEESQQEAMQAGAMRGFGKSHIGDISIRDRVADEIASL